MHRRLNKFLTAIIMMALFVSVVGCGSGSNSDTEDALRAELAETKAQLDQAQQVIASLQSGDDAETVQEDAQSEEGEDQDTEDDDNSVDQSEEELETLLAGTYTWLEQSDEVQKLQEALGIEADGWYGNDTRTAHIAALEERELAIDNVPEKPCPAQTSLNEAIGTATTTSDPILVDVDGDGTMDEATIVTVDESVYVTVATSFNGSTAWIEATGTATASEATYVPQFGTDINVDGLHELWVKTIPVSEPTGDARTHYMYVFIDCALQVVTNSGGSPYRLPRGELLDTGGLLYIDCVTLEDEPIMVYHEDYPIGEPEDGDYVWAYVPTPLRLVGATLEVIATNEIKRDIAPAPDPLPSDSCQKWS
ncbi:MAG: hypothetical protein CL463_07165 [Acidimicrobiaceae bacterium]|nr:hypothetical protein [Acidimicrobiaceae bacterium]